MPPTSAVVSTVVDGRTFACVHDEIAPRLLARDGLLHFSFKTAAWAGELGTSSFMPAACGLVVGSW